MPCCFALILAAATPAALPPSPTGTRGAVVTATAGVSVTIIRAERTEPQAPPESTRRTLHKDRTGVTVVFE